MKVNSVIILMIMTTMSCVDIAKPYTQLPPGIWRAELTLSEDDILPFNFESSYDDNDEMHINIINAEERIPVSEITFGRTKDLRDTVVIPFPLMDSYISAQYKENVIEGYWHVNNREDYKVPFVAFHGQAHRFTTKNETPAIDLSGRWQATFEVETEDLYPAIGEFVQAGNKLTGTFLTETGDYRYLQGTVQGSTFSLSCFDGAHAFLFTGDISKNETLTGRFLSGKHYKTNWIASRNESATLTNPYELSQITTPDKKISFTLPNTEGNMISLGDNQYNGKPKLITMMGTWCPNCLDESKFLLKYLEENPNQQFEIIALAFEKYRDKDKAISTIHNYKKRMSIPYEVLFAGYYDKAEATENIGFIDKIISYPTLLFVNKENEVVKVYTGFSGPATSGYKDFVIDFETELSKIL